MEIILIENVKNVGKLGQVAKVSSGYARNFLIPYGKAVPATKSNLEVFEKKREELEHKAQERLSNAEKRAEAMKELTLTLEAMASDEGKLYGSVHVHELAKLFKENGHEISRSEILLGNPIRELGSYSVKLQLHPDVTATVTVNIQAASTLNS